MNPGASSLSKWKVPELISYIEEERKKKHLLPFIALSETWLKGYISDAQIQIPGYDITRSDRGKRIGGGVLLYSHESIPVTKSEKYDDEVCQALFVKFDSIKTCIINVYRPPDSAHESFKSLCNFINSNIQDLDDDSYQIDIVGDFNFPQIDWEQKSIRPGNSSESNLSANTLLTLMEEMLLDQ